MAAVSGNDPLPSASKTEILPLYDTAVYFKIQVLKRFQWVIASHPPSAIQIVNR